MTAFLPTPTIRLVLAASDQFNRDLAIPESALRQLLEQFPKNTDNSHVLLKVVALDRLYATNIFDVWTVSSHITELKIDQRLANGAPGLVDLIANAPVAIKPRKNYSFATKYCSWHNPAAYPIYDKNVSDSLLAYNAQDPFSTFGYDDIRIYDTFVKVITDFRDHYDLASVTFKQIDKFLWAQGKTIRDNKTAEKARIASTAA
jgi:hypothetical protein